MAIGERSEWCGLGRELEVAKAKVFPAGKARNADYLHNWILDAVNETVMLYASDNDVQSLSEMHTTFACATSLIAAALFERAKKP